jgi:type III pantothenate kinase
MTPPLFVADVGNSTIDFAEFQPGELKTDELAKPLRTWKVRLSEIDFESLDAWSSAGGDWIVGSVNRPAQERLLEWLSKHGVGRITRVRHTDLRTKTAVRRPEVVGIDRLAAAESVNVLRHADRPAVIVDAGSAITIDVVSKHGVFLGGMIAPGARLCAAALSNDTNQLPEVDVVNFGSLLSSNKLSAPELIGDDTQPAIQAGVYWMIAAGIDGIIARLQNELAGPCDVFATGGSMPQLLPQLSHDHVQHVPHLVVAGLRRANRTSND